MKSYITTALTALALLTTTHIHADKLQGLVTGYVPLAQGNSQTLIFKLDTSSIEQCNVTGRFAISESQPHYDTMVSSIVAAMHAKTTITVDYLNQCDTLSNAYDVRFICIGDINC